MRIRTNLVNLRLSVKILLVLVTVITAMTVVTTVVAYDGVTNLTRQAGDERIAEEVLIIQAQVASAEAQLVSDAKYLAQNLAFNEGVLAADLPAIQSSLLLSEATPSEIDHVLVVGRDGKSLVELVDRKVVPVDESSLNDPLSFALLGISVSTVFEQDGLVLVATAPIQTNAGDIVGAVQIGRKLDDSFLRAINFARPGTHLVLLNTNGEVVAAYIKELHANEGNVNALLAESQPETSSSPEEEITHFGVTLLPDMTESALGGEVKYQQEFIYNAQDKPLIAAYVPLVINYDVAGAVAILVDLDTLNSFRNDLILEQIQALALIGLASAALLVLMAWWWIVFPIEQLQQATVQLASGDYLHRAKVRSKDEIGRLAIAFNQMATSLLTRDQQLTAEIAERTGAEQALRRSRDQLELRVIERTHELQVANDQLQVELEHRNQAEQQIRASLQEKEVLLKEIHHRVKNNMQVMSSLLRLQSNYTDEAHTIEVLRESQHRVRSMALVHERLYQSSDLSGIPVSDYVHDLVQHLAESYRSDNHHIAIAIQVDELTLDLDTAIPCGLILNELVSNAFKHAFHDRSHGEIRIELRGEGKHLSKLIVQDDGVGFPEGMEPKHANSLGLQLVTSLVRQLDGAINLLRDEGTSFVLQFANPLMTTDASDKAVL